MEYKNYLICFGIYGRVDCVIYRSSSMKKAVNSFMQDFKRKPMILSISVLDDDITEEDLATN